MASTDELSFRPAESADLPELVRMLADDALGATHEDASDPIAPAYREAFDTIDADPLHELILATRGETILGFLQLTMLPGLTYRGSWRAQIEGVRVRSDQRGGGVGGALVEYAIQRARDRSCRMVQLTSDKRRPDAIRFYERYGFVASHEGFKLVLDGPGA